MDRRIDKEPDIEFRYWDDELDEIVARGVNVHFECMGTGAWWMMIQTADGRDYHVNLGVHKKGRKEDSDWRDKHLVNWAFHELDA